MNNLRGKRGGSRNKSVDKKMLRREIFYGGRWRNIDPQLDSTRFADATSCKYNEWAPNIEETIEDHIIPRHSLTTEQHLRLFPAIPTKTIRLKTRQLDKVSGKMIETSDIRVLKMSDKTLLNQSKPWPFIALPEGETYFEGFPTILKRQTSRTKRIKVDEDAKLPDRKRQP